jgi:hypothetical protein
LLLAGFIAFTATYVLYAQLLGWMDGLPQLPEQMLKPGTSEFQPPDQRASPTGTKLAEAFGAKAPETNYAFYPNQFTFVNGETLLVLASGPVPSNPNSNRVTLVPFSLAIFGKPKPPHLRQPGEVAEITTIHADKGVLTFDHTINSPNDMRTSKLLRLDLISDREEAFEDPRRGIVHIRNNQRSADENESLTIRSPGPVFYRDPKAAVGTVAAQGPDFWTDAPVEIVDRRNLPRQVGTGAPNTAVAKTDEVRNGAAVEAMIAGQRPPPPTVTAIGMRVYLEPPGSSEQAARPKKAGSGLQGVRRIELLERAVVHLWVDNGQSLVGDDAPPPEPAKPAEPDAPDSGGGSSVLALTPPPAGLAALMGNLGTSAYTARLLNRALLQIETRGPFFYDAEKSLARFDVLPHADPNLPNDVQVTKVPAHAGTSTLFSEVLELGMNGGATAANRPANAPPINRVHAWTTTPGRFLTASSQDEQTEAYGRDLVHDRAARRTDLTGAPLYVVRERNVLTAGSAQRAATLVTKPGPGKGPEAKSEMTVYGPGRIDLFDTAANTTGPTATWRTTMVQTKDLVNGGAQDLFTFTDDAKFEDVKADYWLKGKVLKLWLEPRADDGKPATPKPPAAAGAPAAAPAPQPKPSRIQAIGTVTSHSSDYDIDESSQLNVFFADPKPAPAPAVAGTPKPPASSAEPPPARSGSGSAVTTTAPAPKAGSPAAQGSGPGPMAVAEAPAPEPEQPKPPYKIRAKLIDTWVNRVPTPAAPPKPGEKPAPKAEPEPAAATKYQLDHATFEDNVTIHQDPTDPTKARGVDILGRQVRIKGSPEGNIMDVYGWPTRPGEVHQEDTSILGPDINLDQVHNTALVKGRGALTMPTNSDLSGSELAQPEVVVIHWRDRMDFRGTLRSAEFEGKVSARQGDSCVLCSTMSVKFDRPVYFNQTQKTPPKPKEPKGPNKPNGAKGASDDDKPKIDTVFCYPAADDASDENSERYVAYNQVEHDPSGKLIKSQWLTAQELKMFAQFQDPGTVEKYQRVEAFGPGVLRIWQLGDKDPGGPGPSPEGNKPGQPKQPTQPKQATQPKQPGQTPRPAGQPTGPVPPGGTKQPDTKSANPDDDQEMKLTVVTFGSRMTAIDKNKMFQQATFLDNIQVINVPADSPDLKVDRYKLPPRAQLLTCDKKLVVVTIKKPNAPTEQNMDAFGNSALRTDEYDGWGETITSAGPLVTLTGSSALPARVMNRFGRGNEQAGSVIKYNRVTGSIKVVESAGGTFGGSK